MREKPQGCARSFEKILQGNYDIFFKYNTKDSKLIKERRKRLHNHIRSEIHSWCADREVQKVKENEIIEGKNVTAARMIVTSAIQSLLELDFSLKFTRENNMLHILLKDYYPTKNYGKDVYDIRDLVFTKLTSEVQEFFFKC